MSKKFTISPATVSATDGFIRHTFAVTVGTCQANREFSIWFEFDDSIQLPDTNDCSAPLIALILDAMQEKADVIIEGQVDEVLLANITEYQRAWSKWVPSRYRMVDISAKTILPRDTLPKNSAVSAFSGGVDASFTAWMHATKKLGASSKPLSHAVMMHGLDIPLDDESAFNSVTETAQQTLKDIEVHLVKARTNARYVTKVDWEHNHAGILASMLNCMKKHCGYGLVGSGEDYAHLPIPWGSNPITDPLLSTATFTNIHDGAGYSRSEKIQQLLDWEIGRKELRVCWAGQQRDRNCGVCEKCIRTKLNFMVFTQDAPDCFEPSNIVKDIFSINSLPSTAIRKEWLTVKEELKDSPYNAQLARYVALNMLKCRFLDFCFPPNSKIKKIIGSVRG